jgi:hypothetical protein
VITSSRIAAMPTCSGQDRSSPYAPTITTAPSSARSDGMSNMRINRDINGTLHLEVSGRYASGARVTGFSAIDGEMCAIVVVPLKHAVLGEIGNVIPFVRPVVETR